MDCLKNMIELSFISTAGFFIHVFAIFGSPYKIVQSTNYLDLFTVHYFNIKYIHLTLILTGVIMMFHMALSRYHFRPIILCLFP